MKKILPGFVVFLALATSSTFFATCVKEYSYEGGDSTGNSIGTAVYSMVGEGGECLGSVVSGTYFTAVPLTSDNIVLLQVHVSVAGTYSLGTTTLNGLRFTSSGNFTDTGLQVITLRGTGTPEVQGDFIFNTPVGEGCFFTITVKEADKPKAGFTLSGAPGNCDDPQINGDYIAGVAMTTANTVRLNVNVTLAGPYTITTDTLDGIYFSASGNFTSLGSQTVMLTAHGTPLLPRNVSFTPRADASACSFEVTFVNQGQLATYVLESGFGTPNPCISTIAGNYTAGVPLAASNTVSISVYVATEGNFTIATDIVNGMIFSYSGSFAAKGTQKVILQGSGTPGTIGTCDFIPRIVGPAPLGGSSCGFSISVN